MVKQEDVKADTINVISQYNAQRSEIKKTLEKAGFPKVNVNTVSASQGTCISDTY